MNHVTRLMGWMEIAQSLYLQALTTFCKQFMMYLESPVSEAPESLGRLWPVPVSDAEGFYPGLARSQGA
jgi:hypothetical protein